MSIFSVCAFAVGSVILVIIVRQLKNEIALPLSVCITVTLALVAVALIEPITDYINEISQASDYSAYVKVMMKSLGIALISSSGADICRDCGEGAVGAKVELVGKCAILLVALPLIKSLLTLAQEIMYA